MACGVLVARHGYQQNSFHLNSFMDKTKNLGRAIHADSEGMANPDSGTGQAPADGGDDEGLCGDSSSLYCSNVEGKKLSSESQQESRHCFHIDTRMGNMLTKPVAEMTKDERRELRKSLKLDLEKVTSLTSKIEARELQLREQSHSQAVNLSLSDAQFSGNAVRNCGGKEVTSQLEITPVKIPAFQTYQQHSLSYDEGKQGGVYPSAKEKRTPKANQLYRKSEFILGNEKMPTAEKPKPKSAAGNKRAATAKLDGRDLKRLEWVNKLQSKNNYSELMKQCGHLLKKLMGQDDGWIFNEPVDAVKLHLPDYHLVINKPMDLGTIKMKLHRKEYPSPLEFAEDVRLTFSNAMKYNPAGNDVHKMADAFRNIFEESWNVIALKFEEQKLANDKRIGILEQQDVGPQKQSQPQRFLVQEKLQSSKTPAPRNVKSGKTPVLQKPKSKPKPKSEQKREMNFSEKQKLGLDLQSLPPEKLEYIVRLMIERNPALRQKDEEIEVDIESFDKETLWELHAFVASCRKSIGKKKDVNSTHKNQSLPDGERLHTNNEAKELGGEKVNLKDTMPKPEFPPVEMEKNGGYANRSSSSGSSSSGSGSSSDSDSSSGSESDADDIQSADGKR